MKGAVKQVSGVQNVNVNLEKRQVSVQYDASKVDEAKVSQAIVAAGYTPE